MLSEYANCVVIDDIIAKEIENLCRYLVKKGKNLVG